MVHGDLVNRKGSKNQELK